MKLEFVFEIISKFFRELPAIGNINSAILLIEHKTTKMHSIMQMHQYLLHSRQNQNFLKLNESKSI